MRWEVTKKAWAMAREKFPKIEKLFVDVPERFLAVGQCRVLDLSSPQKPLAIISYDVRPISGQPQVVLSMGGKTESVALPRFGSVGMDVSTGFAGTPGRTGSLDAWAVMDRYVDPGELAEQVAKLAAWHEGGMGKTAMTEDSVAKWMKGVGFPHEEAPLVCDELRALGLSVAPAFNRRLAKYVKPFEVYDQVRIKMENSMEHNECGQILERKRDKGKRKYLVLVDGSSEPEWFFEDAIKPNMVGRIKNDAV